jgi:U6 snRNA m6A methyltransferase
VSVYLSISHWGFKFQGLNGKVKIDFKNEQALRSLTRCLLLKDFGLDVELPPDKLVPTLPLRLNYILWLEDIFIALGRSGCIAGIDIGRQTSLNHQTEVPISHIFLITGCGASCIYPLLAAKSKKWKMYAIELNEESCVTAQRNVDRNQLNDHIQIFRQTEKNKIFESLFGQTDIETFDFCMCNPPFYDLNEKNFTRNRSGDRAEPKNAKTGSKRELAVEGGELKFVESIIQESVEHQDKILVYTTMLGHKSSVKKVMGMLRSRHIKYISTTEFCQGRTMRWGVAWSFSTSLRAIEPHATIMRRSSESVTSYVLPPITESLPLTLSTAVHRLNELFDALKIELKLIKRIDDLSETFQFCAYENTWSHQRRKRREIVKLPGYQNKINQAIELGEGSVVDTPNPKRVKIDITEPEILLEALVCVENRETETADDEPEDNEIVLKISFIKGNFGRDGVNQVMQYLKNNWKLRK